MSDLDLSVCCFEASAGKPAKSSCSACAGYEASPFVKLTREVLPTPTAEG